MNEFYLIPEGEASQQYTMCHELGYAFGLPHSDEEYSNEDLGNCLDYTYDFEKSKHPDESLYESLADKYGVVSGDRRNLRAFSPLNRKRKAEEMPELIRENLQQVVARMEKRLDNNAHEDGWKLLHRNEFGEEHELELGEGYKVHVHMLLA